MEGTNVEDFKFSKKAQVITMNDSASVQVGGDELQIDPQLHFQRLIVATQGAEPVDDLQNFFAYELCTYPPALFESAQLLRQANKSVIAKDITNSIPNDDSRFHPFETKYVFNRAWLIQKLNLLRGRTYKELCEMYVKYVTDYYPNSHVVFDGYRAGPSTKDNTHTDELGDALVQRSEYTMTY
ncbi:hypothetical protein MAR_005822 [Mya arenaria]|uniref:Uncharacterized protein n=1 Tax=Mya arenaria TaxID=6604 RepID=A0ABY7F3S6_MYAAR|nr:hypothetical protein MAR_005822 [Mya arenaria]